MTHRTLATAAAGLLAATTLAVSAPAAHAGYDCSMYHHKNHHEHDAYGTWHHFHFNDGSGRSEWARYSGPRRAIGSACWTWTLARPSFAWHRSLAV